MYVHQRLRLIGNEPWRSTPKGSAKIGVKRRKTLEPPHRHQHRHARCMVTGTSTTLSEAASVGPPRAHCLDHNPERAQQRARRQTLPRTATVGPPRAHCLDQISERAQQQARQYLRPRAGQNHADELHQRNLQTSSARLDPQRAQRARESLRPRAGRHPVDELQLQDLHSFQHDNNQTSDNKHVNALVQELHRCPLRKENAVTFVQKPPLTDA